jgi:hypothetical protein
MEVGLGEMIVLEYTRVRLQRQTCKGSPQVRACEVSQKGLA